MTASEPSSKRRTDFVTSFVGFRMTSSLSTASSSSSLHLFLLLVLLLFVSSSRSVVTPPLPPSVAHSSFCSVYSHNWRGDSTGPKVYFACCANPEHESCHGLTYQNPGRDEAFCRGQVTGDVGNQWTQQEVDFGYHGYFYCGECCGQHLAADGCDEDRNRKWKAASGEGGGGGGGDDDDISCFNWVLCFMKRCQQITDNISRGRSLGCSLPPPPYPKHYMDDTRTLPVNYSLFFHLSTTTATPGSRSSSTECGEEECNALKMETRCQTECCSRFCCLQDGSTDAGGNGGLAGQSFLQMAGVVVALVAFVVFVVLVSVALGRRYAHAESTTPSQDSRILVVDGREEQNDSDTESV